MLATAEKYALFLLGICICLNFECFYSGKCKNLLFLFSFCCISTNKNKSFRPSRGIIEVDQDFCKENPYIELSTESRFRKKPNLRL